MKNILLFLCLVEIISLGNTQIINSDDFCFSKSNLLFMHKESINNISEFMSKLEYEKVTETEEESLNLYSSTEAYNFHQWTKDIGIFPFKSSVSVYEYSNKPNIVVINLSKKCFDTLISQMAEFKVNESNDPSSRILSFEIEPGYKQDFREKRDKHSDNPFQIYLSPSPKIEPLNLPEEIALHERQKIQLIEKEELSKKLSDSIKNQKEKINYQSQQLAQKQKELRIQDSLIKVKQQHLIEQEELEQFLKQEAIKRKIEEQKVIEDIKLQEFEATLQKQESVIQAQKDSLHELDKEIRENMTLLVDYPDQDATFPGGVAAMNQFLADNIKYPEIAMESGDQGKVFIEFIVEKDGSIIQIKILRGVSKEIDREAKRVVSLMPKWAPAESNGEAVRARCRIQISFSQE